jgi:2-oxo-4-hydroxy-4-carboxy-5-ureidoimidazoline decarboxylase
MSDARLATKSDLDLAPSGVAALNRLAPEAAHEALLGCCASERWATTMERGRPYASSDALFDRVDEAFDTLAREDWLQAFAAHAQIGAPRAADERGAKEQAGVSEAGSEELAALRVGNQRYEARFGHVFLVRASGLDAQQMLASLRERLENEAEVELEIAAQQQREITRLRLGGLLAS